MKLIFCIQINIKVSLKFISTLWASKFPTRLLFSITGIIKHSQITQGNKFPISLQYLRKQLGMEGISGMQINVIKFLQVGIIHFDGSGQTCPQYPKQEVGNICARYLKKNDATALCYIVMQNIQIFYRGPVMFG